MTLARNALILALGLLAAAPAQAAEPPAGTLTPTSGDLVYTGGPFVVPNLSPQVEPICEDDGQTCDVYALTVDLPADYLQRFPGSEIHLRVEWPSPEADFDVYVRDASGEVVAQAASSSNPELAVFPALPGTQTYRLEVIPFLPLAESFTGTVSLVPGGSGGGGGGDGGGVDLCSLSGQPNGGLAGLSLEAFRRFHTLPESAPMAGYLYFSMGSPLQWRELIARSGLRLVHSFERYLPAIFVTGTVGQFKALRTEPSIRYIEAHETLRFLGDTQSWATRVRVAQEAVSGGPYFDRQGRVLTGEGVTVSVHDSGLNALQGDFGDRLLGNWKAVGDPLLTGTAAYQDLGATNTDTTSGHGTHVIGTVGGDGRRSTGDYAEGTAPAQPGTYTGAAPGASLLMYSVGEVIEPVGVVPAGLLIYIDVSLQHLLDNLASYNPPVRVASFSLGNAGGSPYEPGTVRSCLSRDLVNAGISMVWAAGNSAGDGSADATSSFCKDPTPGVICVASYDDGNTGKLDGGLSSFSSRGERGRPETYPDIAAPGSNITSTCLQGLQGQITCTTGAETTWLPWYGTISGTSMATPHVAGALALLYQARPELTPAEAERLIKNTARKVGADYEPDPQNPGGTRHFGFGAGLLDLPAALDALGVAKAGAPAAGIEQRLVSDDVDDSVSVLAADVREVRVQESAAGETPAGITVRLTLADASDLSPLGALAYTLEMNANGVPVASSVLLDGSGPQIAEASSLNSAVPSSVSLDGNVLSFFVPYEQMGRPPRLAPLHNLRLTVRDAGGRVEDRVPSLGSPEGNTQENLFPMLTRPLTVLQQAPPPPAERACALPGITQVTSGPGTSGLASLPTGQDDLRQAWIAEPSDQPGKLVFTLKMANLAAPLPPDYRWYMYFGVPGGELDYFVAMDTTQGLPRFLYGTLSPLVTPAITVGTFTVLGTLDAASTYSEDGTITLVLDKASFPLPITAGMPLARVAASIRQTTNPVNGAGLTVDSAAAVLPYVVTDGVCADAPVGGPGQSADPDAPASGQFGGALGAGLLGLLLLAAGLGRRRR